MAEPEDFRRWLEWAQQYQDNYRIRGETAPATPTYDCDNCHQSIEAHDLETQTCIFLPNGSVFQSAYLKRWSTW